MFYAINVHKPRSIKNQIQTDLIELRVLTPFQSGKSVDIRHKVNGSVNLQAIPGKGMHNTATFNPIIEFRVGNRVVINAAHYVG